MDWADLAHAAVGFLAGGVFIAACSVVAEYFGPKVGGVVSGLPSTVAIALLVEALTVSPSEAVHVASRVPDGLALNCLLLGTFARMVSQGAVVAFTSAVGVWFVAALLLVSHGHFPFGMGIGFLACALGAGWGIAGHFQGAGTTSRPKMNAVALAYRVGAGGTVVATSILVAQMGGALAGGLAASFPAASVTTLAIVSRSMGARFAGRMARPMMLSGALSILAFVAVVRLTFIPLGPWAGSILGFAAAATVAWALITFGPFMTNPNSRHNRT